MGKCDIHATIKKRMRKLKQFSRFLLHRPDSHQSVMKSKKKKHKFKTKKRKTNGLPCCLPFFFKLALNLSSLSVIFSITHDFGFFLKPFLIPNAFAFCVFFLSI